MLLMLNGERGGRSMRSGEVHTEEGQKTPLKGARRLTGEGRKMEQGEWKASQKARWRLPSQLRHKHSACGTTANGYGRRGKKDAEEGSGLRSLHAVASQRQIRIEESFGGFRRQGGGGASHKKCATVYALGSGRAERG